MKHPKQLIRDMIGHNDEHQHVWVYDETLSTHPVRCKTCGIYRQNQANMILVKRGRRV